MVIAIFTVLFFAPLMAVSQVYSTKTLFPYLNLDYPGLENVRNAYNSGDTVAAMESLLVYFRNRQTVRHPIMKAGAYTPQVATSLPDSILKVADSALQHSFKVNRNFPFYFYGTDINWQYWPVQDNELRWQLHRMYWWNALAQTYWYNKNEIYANEWTAEYKDWILKNPLGLSSDNDRFAWRALEVSERIEYQLEQFLYFLNSVAFTGDFLKIFLSNYYFNTNYLTAHLTDDGNQLIYEAQRLIYAGTFFPEFKDANSWVSAGFIILQNQMDVQVYDDGVQNELSFNYDVAIINNFYKAVDILQLNNKTEAFSASFFNKLKKMMYAVNDFSFPDYTYPMFSDAQLPSRSAMLGNFKDWSALYPDDAVLSYNANNKLNKPAPTYNSSYLPNSGIYTFRNGWSDTATVMVLKAGPAAGWHSQPDNGTFELYHKGRNFFPDPGAYIYEGDNSINAERTWFKQTNIHNTLTLNGANITVAASLLKWDTSSTAAKDYLVYENPSYTGLKHRRSVYFLDKKFFVLIDEAIGTATGTLDLHFATKEGGVYIDQNALAAVTGFTDNNNIVVRTFPTVGATINKEENYVSYSYNQKLCRPGWSVSTQKNDGNPIRYITIIYPVANKDAVPVIDAQFTYLSDNAVDAQVTIGDKIYSIGYNL